jgi:predicted Zn-dependent protease
MKWYRNCFRDFCWLILIISLPVTAIELPEIGTSANLVMSLEDEKKLGTSFFRQLRLQVELMDDPQINDYINNLGYRLASFSNKPEQRFKFFVVKDPSINAFAVPGGFIGVNSGLILKTRNEAELASVLAHEIAHVTQRHIARSVEASKRMSLPMMAGLLAGLVAGIANPAIAHAAVMSVMAGNMQLQINFTRSHEKEADRVGIENLANAGFDTRYMWKFFQRLQVSSRLYDNVPEFLRTHPVTTDRIAESRDRAEQYPRKWQQDTPFYHLMKAKVLVLSSENHKQLLKRLKTMLKTKQFHDERAIRFAIAEAALSRGLLRDVEIQLNWLLKHDNDRAIYSLLQARLEWLKKKRVKATRLYDEALKTYPGNVMIGLDYAEKLLQDENGRKAKQVLLRLSSENINPYYYRLLSRAYQLNNEKAQAHLALSEWFYLMGKTRLALEQVNFASKYKADYYLKARIKTRHRILQAELLEEQELKK